MIDQASKTKNSADLAKELRRMERDNLGEFLEHLQNFSDTWLDAMAGFYSGFYRLTDSHQSS